MHEIIEGLYLGGLVDALNADLLKRSNVLAIVTCLTPTELPVSIMLHQKRSQRIVMILLIRIFSALSWNDVVLEGALRLRFSFRL